MRHADPAFFADLRLDESVPAMRPGRRYFRLVVRAAVAARAVAAAAAVAARAVAALVAARPATRYFNP